jgi:hypothetical protein
MGNEFAPVLIWPIVAFLVYLAVSGRRRSVTSRSTVGLGRGRLALGYLAVLLVCLAYAYWDTIDLSNWKVARGHVTQLEANQYFWNWYINGFSLAALFCLFVLTALGLPTLAVLRRLRLTSVVGVCIGSQIIAFLLALFPLLFPWCSVHATQCVANYYTELALWAFAMALAFAVAARLPLFRWREHAS